MLGFECMICANSANPQVHKLLQPPFFSFLPPSLPFFLSLKNIYSFYMYGYVVCLCICVLHVCLVPREATKTDPWYLSYR